MGIYNVVPVVQICGRLQEPLRRCRRCRRSCARGDGWLEAGDVSLCNAEKVPRSRSGLPLHHHRDLSTRTRDWSRGFTSSALHKNTLQMPPKRPADDFTGSKTFKKAKTKAARTINVQQSSSQSQSSGKHVAFVEDSTPLYLTLYSRNRT